MASLCGATEAKAGSTKITFDNLFQNRKLVSETAWAKFSAQSKAQKEPNTSVKIYKGPSTRLLFKNPQVAISQVVRAYSKYKPATKVTFIQYQYRDMKWAFNQLKKLVDSSQLQLFIQNEGGMLFESNCDAGQKNCHGAKALTAANGEAFVLQGVNNELPVSKSEKARLQTGMLEAHEYFHTLQDVPFIGKGLERDKYPPMWLTEGSAELVQNLAINQGSFKSYLEFIKNDSMNLYGNYINRDPEYLSEYLDFSNNKNYWADYPNDTAYSLGSRICEILVAIEGPNSLIDINYELGKGIGFEKAFVNVYGKSWKSIQPTVARTLAANIKDFL
jgi:hypothetical protein